MVSGVFSLVWKTYCLYVKFNAFVLGFSYWRRALCSEGGVGVRMVW